MEHGGLEQRTSCTIDMDRWISIELLRNEGLRSCLINGGR